MCSVFTRIFQNILNKQAPLKQKKVQGNQAPFMTKDLNKAIMKMAIKRKQLYYEESRKLL